MKVVLIIAGSCLIFLLAVGWLFNRISSCRGWQKGLNSAMKRHNRLPFSVDRQWLEHNAAKDIYRNFSGKLQLHAYEVDKGHDNWVIICHGYTSNAKKMTVFAAEYDKMGYNILMPDARAHGASAGKFIGMGWPDRRDIVGWAQYLNEQHHAKNIILHGVSMGGTTVMMASGEADLPDNVKTIIEDCGYVSVLAEFRYLIRKMYHLPPFLVLAPTNLFYLLHNGFSFFHQGFAQKQVARSVTPILFIHGADDKFVPCSMMEEAYAAAGCEKEKLVIACAGHGKSCVVEPEKYWSKVRNFIGKYIV